MRGEGLGLDVSFPAQGGGAWRLARLGGTPDFHRRLLPDDLRGRHSCADAFELLRRDAADTFRRQDSDDRTGGLRPAGPSDALTRRGRGFMKMASETNPCARDPPERTSAALRPAVDAMATDAHA
jgi:hypothetical protein